MPNRREAATLDGFVNDLDAVFEAKFMLPWSFSEEAAAEKHMAQLQHYMWVTNARSAVLSIITGGGKWIEMTIPADALYQHFLITAERRFWRCVQTGQTPRPYGVEPPRPRVEAVRVVDMGESNSWAEFGFSQNPASTASASAVISVFLAARFLWTNLRASSADWSWSRSRSSLSRNAADCSEPRMVRVRRTAFSLRAQYLR